MCVSGGEWDAGGGCGRGYAHSSQISHDNSLWVALAIFYAIKHKLRNKVKCRLMHLGLWRGGGGGGGGGGEDISYA